MQQAVTIENDNFAEDVKGWMLHPFSEDMDLAHWALFTILIVTIATGWTFVMKHYVEQNS